MNHSREEYYTATCWNKVINSLQNRKMTVIHSISQFPFHKPKTHIYCMFQTQFWWALNFSRERRTPGCSRGTWAGQGSWRSSGARCRWRCLMGCVLASRCRGEGTDPSNRSSCSGEAGRSWGEAGRFPPLCNASWTGRRTSHLHSEQREENISWRKHQATTEKI